ncbi:hypothetical protein GCM10020229_58230 [Kitasatospora albolonga]
MRTTASRPGRVGGAQHRRSSASPRRRRRRTNRFGITEEDLRAAHTADLVIRAEEGVQRIHERARHRADEIHPLRLTV